MLILRNRAAVDAFARPKVSLGAEMTVTAGPVGAGAMVRAFLFARERERGERERGKEGRLIWWVFFV